MPRTRLAPSPTGALHLGNARTFLVNWALARQQSWEIVLRIEDLDGPRVKTGASEQAIEDLRWLGLDWDKGPYFQREDYFPYTEALHRLSGIYPCRCTRREIQEAALSAPHGDEHELRYSGRCRPREIPPEELEMAKAGDGTLSSVYGSYFRGMGDQAFLRDPVDYPWRIIVPNGVTSFVDHFYGPHKLDIQATTGDFIVATKGWLPSYQLAVVVDDARQGIDRIVRGDDLLGSTHRQLLLQQRLGLSPTPEYWHLPLVVGEDGRRLAKRHGDSRLSHYRELGVPAERIIGLVAEWCGLGARRPMNADEFLEHFDLGKVPHEKIVFIPSDDAWLRGS